MVATILMCVICSNANALTYDLVGNFKLWESVILYSRVSNYRLEYTMLLNLLIILSSNSFLYYLLFLFLFFFVLIYSPLARSTIKLLTSYIIHPITLLSLTSLKTVLFITNC